MGNRDSNKSRIKYIDEIMHRISKMDQADDEAQLSEMIPGLLESIGKYALADRAYVFAWITEEDDEYFSNTFEWCAPGINAEINNLRYLPVEAMPNWTKLFREYESIVIRNIENVAESMPEEYGILKLQGIHTVIAVPIFARKTLKGFIGIDNPDIESDLFSIRILADVGGHLGSIQESMKALKLLKEERERLRKKNLVLSGLSLDYTAIYSVNLDTGSFEIVSNLATNNAYIEDESTIDKNNIKNFVEWYADNFVLPEYRSDVKRNMSISYMRKAFEEMDDYHFSYESVTNKAGQSSFQAHVVKKYDKEGHFAIIGFRSVDDVVAQERKYNELLQNELDVISFALPGGVKICNDDEDYSFRYVSEAFARMLGYDTPEELIEAGNGSMKGLAHPDDRENVKNLLYEQYSKQDSYILDYRVRCKDGSYRYIEDRGKRVVDSDGTTENWGLVLDNNDLMIKTIELESEKKANRSKSAFLSRMSHDIRTPLNGIVGLLKIDAAHPDDREQVDANRVKMQTAADHLLSLINDVLQMRKIEEGGVTLAHEFINLSDLFGDISSIIAESANINEITLELKISGTETPKDVIVYGSPLHLRQIFLNVYGNAIKYNRRGGKITTLVDCVTADGKVTCHWKISDTGVGMSQDFLEHIFEPFTQEKQDARTVYQGTGLGMAIVKGLVDKMDGSIQVSSELGKGTTFDIIIPFEEAQPIESENENKKVTAESMEGCHFLLAEDNNLNAEIAEFLLNDEGAEVTIAHNGQEALEEFLRAPEGTYDLIFMDIMMPVMNGIRATRAIRALNRKDAATIPIVAMTANAFVEDREKCLAAGMNDHLSKPIDIDKVKEVVYKYCKR